MKTRTPLVSLFLAAVLLALVSGCSTVSGSSRGVETRQYGFVSLVKWLFTGDDDNRAPLGVPTEQMPRTGSKDAAAVANAAPAPVSTPVFNDGGQPATPRYTVMRDENLEPRDPIAASRISQPAEHRVLYFPGEEGDGYATEGGREVIRVKRDEMAANPFTAGSRGGANIVLSSGPSVPTARDYVAPSRSTAEAASRLSAPRRDNFNTAVGQGLYRVAEYRAAKVRTARGEVRGRVRPLGVVGADPQSAAAAQQALNTSAGEQLVYFANDFGWGGFIADEAGPFSK